jgi:hypothetical protein
MDDVGRVVQNRSAGQADHHDAEENAQLKAEDHAGDHHQ